MAHHESPVIASEDVLDCGKYDNANVNGTGNSSGTPKKIPACFDVLSCEMPERYQKDRGKRMIRSILSRLRLKRTVSVDISQPDPSFKVAYLGNVVTGWAKGDGCVDKPLNTLWRNYTQSSRPDVSMELMVSGGGLKATTREHGLTEYWANRLTCCEAPVHFPRIFCWVYRHEVKRFRHELRCHAVLCASSHVAKQIESALKHSIYLALTEFKRDKVSRQNARLSLVNSIYDNPTMPRRKILLSTGSQNYRPPLERSKSAPKLMSIEENLLEEEAETSEGRAGKKESSGAGVGGSNVFGRRDVLRKNVRRHSVHSGSGKRPTVTQATDFRCNSSTKNNNNNNNINDSNYSNCKVPVFTDENISANDNNRDCDIRDVNLMDIVRTMGCIGGDSLSLVGNFGDDGLLKSALVEEDDAVHATETMDKGGNGSSWFRSLEERKDSIINLESDEGSLSSGCESSSTVTSDIEQSHFGTIAEVHEASEEREPGSNQKKTDFDFRYGSTTGDNFALLSRLKSSSSGVLIEEVSLVPVGESHSDFSSLKVFKRRCHSDSSTVGSYMSASFNEENSPDEGYDEVLDCASSISSVVLV